MYRRLASSIKDYKFEEGEEEEEGCVADDEITTASSINAYKADTNDYAINGVDENSNDEGFNEKLLSTSERASAASSSLIKNHSHRRSSSVSSKSSCSSVNPRSDGRNLFKYKCCSICLSDFT